MNKIELQTLGLIVTDNCNLNCGHCLRGCSRNKIMSDNVIDKTFNQISHIDTLAISGGEPTLVPKTIEKIIESIIENNVSIGEMTFIINGTIYNEEFLRLIDYAEQYINRNKSKEPCVSVQISSDLYHKSEIERLKIEKEYFENLKKYTESKYYTGLRELKNKLFREGNAQKLSEDLTVELKTMPILLTYYRIHKTLFGKRYIFDRENGQCYIGPIVAINPDGIVTECDSSIENQETIYNYGNVLTDGIEDICLNRKKSMILKPEQMFRRSVLELKRYTEYDK